MIYRVESVIHFSNNQGQMYIACDVPEDSRILRYHVSCRHWDHWLLGTVHIARKRLKGWLWRVCTLNCPVPSMDLMKFLNISPRDIFDFVFIVLQLVYKWATKMNRWTSEARSRLIFLLSYLYLVSRSKWNEMRWCEKHVCRPSWNSYI